MQNQCNIIKTTKKARRLRAFIFIGELFSCQFFGFFLCLSLGLFLFLLFLVVFQH